MKKYWMMGITAIIMMGAANVEAKDWVTNFKKASATAKESGKYILLDFCGSDWCGWCKKLDNEVFSKNEFKKYAKSNLVCVQVDFPRYKRQNGGLKKQNAKLMKQYGVQGFPTVILLAPDGELVGKTGYRKGGPKQYVEYLKGMIDKHKSKQKKGKQ